MTMCERYTPSANLDSLTAYVLRFCHNSDYRNERKIAIGIKYRIICLHLYSVGRTLWRGYSRFQIFTSLKKSSEFHSICPFWDRYELLRLDGRFRKFIIRYEKELYFIRPSTFVGAHGELPELIGTTCISNISIKVFEIWKFRIDLHDIFSISWWCIPWLF